MGRKYMILIVVSLFLIAIDQIAKIYVHANFELGETITVIPGYFNFTYVRNIGAAFGIFTDSNETFRHIFFLSIPAIAVGIIVFFIYGLPETERAQILALSAIAGGAVGNYIDRIQHGFVIDFLDFHIQNIYSWPVFNIADSAIVIGVAVLTVLMIVEFWNERKKATAGGQKPAKS
ncbi:MAG: signal peptidase II [Bdellovibrionota bacterium]